MPNHTTRTYQGQTYEADDVERCYVWRDGPCMRVFSNEYHLFDAIDNRNAPVVPRRELKLEGDK